VDAVLALSTSVAGVATLYASWRRPKGLTRLALPAGWLLLAASVPLWIRVGGAEFGTVFAMIAAAFGAWGAVAALGREPRRPAERRPQPRVACSRPGRDATWKTLARVGVAVPLAGAAGLLLSVLAVAGLPWVPADRYVGAIFMAPIVWGVLATWASLTAALARVALALAAVSAVSAALLFVR
jgi:hypothetical protein